MPVPIPEIRRATDAELAHYREVLADRVQAYWWRAETQGPDPDRDRACASYEALLAMVDKERSRRRRPPTVAELIDRWSWGAEAEPLQDARQDLPHVDQPALVQVPAVDVHAMAPMQGVG